MFNSVPVIGGTFTVRVDGVPSSQSAWLLVGESNTSWGGSSLPLALSAFGMPGCDLLVSPDLSAWMGVAGASHRVWGTLKVPDGSEFLGAVFYLQAAVLAPGANAAGLLWTNGGRGMIGIRP